MPQQTNLNVSPYFDDFSASNDFHRVLFKPGYPVQARELTTLQSILQNQLEQFGDHMFREGSKVIPGQLSFQSEYYAVQVEAAYFGIPVSFYAEKLVGKRIKGETSGVTAKVVNYIEEGESDNGNLTFYLQYEKSSTTFSGKTFQDGETLLTLSSITYANTVIASNEGFANAIPSSATATGSAVQITEGVYFLRGNFVRVATQTLILDQYSNTPSYRVGLNVIEEVITAGADESLYDNAQGFSNYSAPGADRLKITAVLAKKEVDELNDENFVEIMRLVDGEKEFFQDDSQYSRIREALAKRTFDESGNYYVKPFRLKVKESLNDRKGNKGLYLPGQTTQDGNTPSSDLMTYQISPGKAYVRGYDIETISNTNVDVPKARTTREIKNYGIDYNAGSQFIVNRAFGCPNVGLGTTAFLSLRDRRIGGVSDTAAGTEIGKARVYNFTADSVNLNWDKQDANLWDLRLFDIQTFTKIGISTNVTISLPARITGDSSGAEGYLTSAVANSDELTVYCNNGSFVKDESFKINGEETGPIVKTVRDYGLQDVFSVYSNPGVGQTFNADFDLRKVTTPIANSFTGNTPTFVITAADQGISTVTSPGNNFAGIVTAGNYIGYSVAGLNTETYNRVSAVSDDGNELTVVSTTNVIGVADGALPTTQITTQAFGLRSVDNQVKGDNSFLTRLPKNNVNNIDITNSHLIVKKQFRNVTVANNEIAISQFSIGADYTYEAFTPSRYVITYGDGRREALTGDQIQFSGGMKNLKFVNLSVAADSQTRVDVTLKKEKPSSKEKLFNVGNTIITRSNNIGSGTTDQSLKDGLTYSSLYGTRVQDAEICLNVPDVIRVLGVYESNDTSDPQLPSITMASISGPNGTTADLIVGEEIISTNGSVAMVVEITNASQIGIVYRNSSRIQIGDVVTFQSSGLQATVTAFTVGDRNVLNKYSVDTGQRAAFYDYGRIVRRKGEPAPTNRLKIISHYYSVPSGDEGDIFSVDSYDSDRYDSDIYYLDSRFTDRLTDYIDIRPRVSTYDPSSATKSPFEFESRVFTGEGQSPTNILSDDETLNLTFTYYLPRIDRIFLTTNGSFQIQVGTPDDNPVPPDSVSGALDIGTVWVPAYTFEAQQVKTLLKSYKRYRMSDIGRIDARVKNLEYYTALSMLESDTKNMSIKDADGLDRFKCGFLVDNFKSSTTASKKDPDYSVSMDRNAGELRPAHYTTAVDLLLGTNAIIGIGQTADPSQDYGFATDLIGSGCRRTGDLITLDYNEVKFVENVFASRTENVQPFAVIFWRGSMELNPSSDVWVDTRRIDAQVVNIEGNYEDTIEEMGADENTGLISTVWNSWQTDWVGVDISTTITNETEVRATEVPRVIDIAGNSGFGQPDAFETVNVQVTAQEVLIEVTNQETTTTTEQSRTGLATRVVERIDSESLGDRVVDRENIPFMRPRNIEFVIKGVKPRTQLFPFFDGEDIAKFCFPKLLEISMQNGTFQVGEKVIASNAIVEQGLATPATPYCEFRLATPNHKYGPYNAPSDTFTANPYDDEEGISEVYTSTATLLNVDTFSLQNQPQGEYYGFINGTMTLRGQSSGAEATVTATRLVSDNVGTLIGSFYVPDGMVSENPQFTAGTKSLRFTSSPVNSLIPGTLTTAVERNYESSGIIETIQETIINTRNAEIVTEDLTDNRVLTDVQRRETGRRDVAVLNTTTTTVQQRIITRWSDPLAQTFSVPEPNGMFLTSVDLFFSTKDDELPCGVEVRTVDTGYPTTTILPFSKKDVPASDITISTDATASTRFTFDSPVYLEGGGEYALVVISPSTEYNVWISRLGEEDISTLGLGESQKILITQQPYLGSLFKSQNASTWSASQFEDLKFTLNKAEFTAGTTGTCNFFNPELQVGNNELVELSSNPIQVLSKKTTLGLTSSIGDSIDTLGITTGVSIAQTGSGVSGGTGRIIAIGGSVVSSGSTESLLAINPGTGYTVATSESIQPYTITGTGSGLEVTVQVSIAGSVYQDPNNKAGLVGLVSVTDGGRGYKIGDVVGIPTAAMNGIGTGAQLSIVSIGYTNTLFLDQVQGDFVAAGASMTYVTNTGIRSEINGEGSNVTILNGQVINDPLYDGKTIKVRHKNHAMHESNNLVKIEGVVSDNAPSSLTSAYGRENTGDLTVSAGTAFTSFENVGVGTTNPGYLKIDDEIIKYTSVSGNTISGITRAQDSTLAFTHPINSLAYKYEFNGVSLRRINKTHNMSEVANQGSHPVTIDSYYVGVDMGETSSDSVAIGTNRSNSANGFPSLYFNQTKSGGESRVKASQNIQFEVLTPNVQTLQPKGTSIASRVRTVTSRSVSGIETSFEDKGYQSIKLNSSNYLDSPRMIASKVNEDSKLTNLPGYKSLNIQCDLDSNDPNISPVIDIDRVSAILTTNRIDDTVSIFSADDRVKIAGEDPTSACYVTKNVGLRVPATGIKVMFSANRAATSDIRVAYALYRQDDAKNVMRYELFPGYDNRDENGAIINSKFNSGLPDKFVVPSSARGDFRDYEFTIDNLNEFNGFKIKIMMTGTNQARPPRIREFRAIALS